MCNETDVFLIPMNIKILSIPEYSAITLCSCNGSQKMLVYYNFDGYTCTSDDTKI